MIFHKTPIAGCFLIDLQPHADARGFFARLFCAEEFEREGLTAVFVQANNSRSTRSGTLRGFHYQLPPAAEAKLIRCVNGALYDVVLDLRPGSATFARHFAATLTADNRTMIYVPKGCANAFLTLADGSEAVYLVSERYHAELERGIRYDDPRFGVSWPRQPVEISGKDRSHPDFNPAWHLNDAMRGLP